MPKQYFYQFSEGSYSDYSVGGLYVCDHEVTEAEWDAHYKAYQEEVFRLSNMIPSDRMLRDINSEEYKVYRKFQEECAPEKTFAELHNMTAVECTELWRDY